MSITAPQLTNFPSSNQHRKWPLNNSGSDAPGLKSSVPSSLWISSSLVWTSTAPITRSPNLTLVTAKMCQYILSTSTIHTLLWILIQVVVGSRKSQPPSVVHFPYCSLSFMRRMFYCIIQCMMSNHTLTCAVHAEFADVHYQIKSRLTITWQCPGMIMAVGISWNLPLCWLLA